MKAKIKSGGHLLFTEGASNKWDNVKDEMIINFMDRYIFFSFYQHKNHLHIGTSAGDIDIVFTGEAPVLEFDSYVKDQLILKVKNG